MTPKLSGYTRLLYEGEQIEAQMDELVIAGVSEVIVDAPGSGRPRLVAWIDQAKPGDALVFTSLERVGANIDDIVRTLVLLSNRRVEWRCMSHPDLHLSGTDVLRALDDAQRKILANGRRSGMGAKPAGRPPFMSTEEISVARDLHRAGRSTSHIARTLGVSRAATFRALKAPSPTAGDSPDLPVDDQPT